MPKNTLFFRKKTNKQSEETNTMLVQLDLCAHPSAMICLFGIEEQHASRIIFDFRQHLVGICLFKFDETILWARK